jgi:hypothetical protein
MPDFSISPKRSLKIISQLNIILGVISCALSIIYFLIPVNSIIYDFFGVTFLIFWLINLIIIYFSNNYLDKSTKIGKKINRLSYYYLASFIGCVLLLVFGVIFTSFIMTGILYIIGLFMIISGFYTITLFGLHLSLTTFLNINSRGAWKFE